jgi:adenylylsulfate kinase-like enzyme
MNHILTGKADAGKTTLAKKMQLGFILDDGKRVFLLDGDDIRIDFPLGYTDEDREHHIIRMGKFTNILNRQGFDVIIAAVLPKKKWRDMLKEIIKEETHLIYVKGGHLWEGTEYEEPIEDESPEIYDWRKNEKINM